MNSPRILRHLLVLVLLVPAPAFAQSFYRLPPVTEAVRDSYGQPIYHMRFAGRPAHTYLLRTRRYAYQYYDRRTYTVRQPLTTLGANIEDKTILNLYTVPYYWNQRQSGTSRGLTHPNCDPTDRLYSQARCRAVLRQLSGGY